MNSSDPELSIQASKSVFIAERNVSGHRLVYVRILAEHAAEQGSQVTIGLPAGCAESGEFRYHLGQSTERFRFTEIRSTDSLSRIRAIAAEHRADHLLIPDGDAFARQAAFGRAPAAGHPKATLLIMRDPRWELVGKPRVALKARIKLLVLRVAQRRSVATIVWLRDQSHQGMGRERSAVDPVILDGTDEEIANDARDYRSLRGMSGDVFWFGVVGMLTERKNVPLVAQSVQALAAKVERPVGLALLGPTGNDATWRRRELIGAYKCQGIPVVSDESLLTNYQMNVAIRSLDCVVIAYSTFSPNSTMGKAAAMGVRLVAAGPPSIRQFAAAACGQAGVPLQLVDLVGALERALVAPPPAARLQSGPEAFASALLL